MRSCGLEVEAATVGDPDPFAAVSDVLLTNRFDELVVSTLPHGVSHWLRLSLPHRLRRLTDLPVAHVTAHPPSRSPRLPAPRAGWGPFLARGSREVEGRADCGIDHP